MGRDAKAVQMCVTNYISIHAPRMGRDSKIVQNI